jgi:predicted MPP superfamily phosphohydrolase
MQDQQRNGDGQHSASRATVDKAALSLTRRAFIGTSAALVAGAGLVGYTTQVEPHWLKFVRRPLRVANLPADLSGATLAQISDLHICSYVDEAYLIDSLDRARAFNPDIVVFTGDFVTWEQTRLAQVDRVLSHFPRGRLATLGIFGNHDYGPTWRDPRVANQIMPLVAKNGIQLLRNETATVAGLDFIGIDDLWSGRADTKRALAQRASSAAIALCHNPDALDELPWGDFSGWVLSGHTHGGQCKPPFLPPPILPVKNRRYTAGEIRVDDKRTLYINRGVGHLLKARFNVRPEITLFTLSA